MPPTKTTTTTWHPTHFLTGHTTQPYAIIILNQPINHNALSAILPGATLLVCADAGADRLLTLTKRTQQKLITTRLPDAIVGDLDSLTPETESYYASKGVQIIKDPDQYSTDFTKALKWIRDYSSSFHHTNSGSGSNSVNGTSTTTTAAKPEAGTLDVVVMGGLGGRVDQGFSQIHHLYMAQNDEQLLNGRIYLLSEQSLTFIPDEGENEIFIEPGTFEENVGIIPMMGPTKISTKGLEWDVEDWLTEFGGQMSTSNHLRSDKILLNVNGKQPLMTFELAKRFCLSA